MIDFSKNSAFSRNTLLPLHYNKPYLHTSFLASLPILTLNWRYSRTFSPFYSLCLHCPSLFNAAGLEISSSCWLVRDVAFFLFLAKIEALFWHSIVIWIAFHIVIFIKERKFFLRFCLFHSFAYICITSAGIFPTASIYAFTYKVRCRFFSPNCVFLHL